MYYHQEGENSPNFICCYQISQTGIILYFLTAKYKTTDAVRNNILMINMTANEKALSIAKQSPIINNIYITPNIRAADPMNLE